MFLIAHLSDGGAERVLSQLSLNFPDDIEQIIVLFERKITYPYNAKLISLESPNNSKKIFIRAYKFFQRIYRLRRIIKKECPHSIISFMGEANFINILSFQNPIITTHVFTSKIPTKKISTKIANILTSILYSRAKMIAVSNGVKMDLVKNYKVKDNRIFVINNPIDIGEIRRLANDKLDNGSLSLNKKIPVIITSGRLTEEKGQWHLIRAFSKIRGETPCKLVILGSGDLEGYLKELVQKLRFQDDVIFLGWQKNPFKYFANANLFVLSSLFEGFGLVLIEAMACGLPVISIDCPSGPREILAPNSTNYQISNIEYAEFGILTPVCDGKFYRAKDPLTKEESILADAIIGLLRDKKLSEHYSKAGMQRAYDFEINKIIPQYLSLLKMP